MPFKDKEKAKTHARTYRQRPEVKERRRKYTQTPKNKERANRLKREREAKNREKYNKKVYEWKKKNPQRTKEINSKSGLKIRTELKKEVFSHYAKPLRCVCCGVKGIEFLTVDHIIPKREMAKNDKMIQFSTRLFGNGIFSWHIDCSFNSFRGKFEVPRK